MTSHLGDAPDIPPPPYSETDIYSNPDSHGHSPVLAQSQNLPAHHRTQSHNNSSSIPAMDDASSAASTSEVIYTPPLSPSSPQSQSFTSGNNNLLSPRHPEQQQNTVSVSSEHLTSASAEAYFESRPVPASCDGNVLQVRHTIVVEADSSPDDFPYRPDWARLDVKEEDWQTFLNYLLPNHAAQRNEKVIDRKLRAEGMDTDDARSARSKKSEKSATDAGIDMTHVEAQLDQIRTPDLQQRQNIEDTVREWNDGFFGPRGMAVEVDGNAAANENYRMPGAWDQSFNNSSPDFATAGTPPIDRRANNSGPSGPPRQPDNTGRWRRFNPINRSDNSSSSGLNIRGVCIDSSGVSIGRNFVANPNGLRIGGIVMDNDGVRIGGRDLLGGRRSSSPPREQPTAPSAPFTPFPPQPPMPPLPPGYSHDQQAYYAQMPPPPPGFPTPPPAPGFDTHDRDEYPDEKAEGRARGPDRHHDHHDHHHGHGHDTGRGRGRGPGRFSNKASHRHRSRSSSSSSSDSSSSSSSSSGSDSDTLSIGSLPDYDDLKDSQLPVTRTYLEEWLSRPENFVTRETVKEAREEIKAARKTAPQDISDPVARDAMRQQVRGMMGQWRVLKREQRNATRQQKRDRRARRKAEKRERRQARRERKRSRREARKEARKEARREGKQARRESKDEWRSGRRSHDHGHGAGHHSHGQHVPFGHHGGPGPFGAGHRGGFNPFGGRGGPFGLGGRDFPGAGFGPGAHHRRGGGGPQGPFQTGPLPCGGGGGSFGAGGQGNWGEGFSRGMADWSRRMGDWSRDMSAARPGGSGPADNPPRFPGAWPADVEDHQQQDREGAGRDGQQEAGIQLKDNDGGPHAASAAMYSSLEAKREALQAKRDALANFEGDPQAEDSEGHKQGAPTLVGMLAEVEELERAVNKLSLEADEQFAKELDALGD